MKNFFRAIFLLRTLLKSELRSFLVSFPVLSFWIRFFPTPKKILTLQELPQYLGPLFIKLAQTLSVRSDLIGKECSESLAYVQDSMPPFDESQAVKTIQDILGSQAFLSIEAKSINAASIAQIHKALTHDGQVVAIKILRPHIRRTLLNDLKILKILCSLAEFLIPQIKSFKLIGFLKEIEQSCIQETDLRLEAAAADRIRENMRTHPHIYVPQIYWQYTTEQIFTTEWVHGQKLHSDMLMPEHVITTLVQAFTTQVLDDGFFHADLHPGNILITTSGKIVLLDFGIVGFISKRMRNFLIRAFLCFLKDDYDGITQAHRDAHMIPKTVSSILFSQYIRSLSRTFSGKTLEKTSASTLIKQLLSLYRFFHLESKPELFLLHKNIFLLEGLARNLIPKQNIWELIRPTMIPYLEKKYIAYKKEEIFSKMRSFFSKNFYQDSEY